MRKSTFIKRLVALFLVVLMSIESFAAVVGDNDGAAFITKAEFDSLKNRFQSQLDRYNTSLDDKIDGAIASYLAGINVSKETTLKLDGNCGYKFPLKLFYNDNFWNNPSSDYYSVGKPEIHAKTITFGLESRKDGQNTNALDTKGAILWTPSNMESNNIGTTVTVQATDQSTPPSNDWAFFNTYMKDANWDISGEVGEVININATSETRLVNGTNYEIFDIVTRGNGHQVFYYKTSVRTDTMWGSFGKTAGGGFAWCGFAFAGLNANRSGGKWVFSADNWSSSSLNVRGSHTSQTTAGYNAWGAGQQQDYTWGTLPYFAGGYSTYYSNIATNELQTHVFKWSNTDGTHNIYAGSAGVYSELDGSFGYTGNVAKGDDARLHYQGMLDLGQIYGAMYNYSNRDITYPLYQFKYLLFQPDYQAVFYNNSTKNTHVSAFPAYQLRYYDGDGAPHYLDEGMFLHTFEENASAKFTLLFGTDTGTKNVKIYVSKEPFSYENMLTKIINFSVSGVDGEMNNYTMTTGTQKTIEVPDILKGESLYLLWVPETNGEYVTLDSFSDFRQISG